MYRLDVLDENGKPAGEQKSDGKVHALGLRHSSAHVWVYNSKGEVLLQRRAQNRYVYPGRWHMSASGHIDAGETPLEGAVRELAEEIGISVEPGDLKCVGVNKVLAKLPKNNWINNEFQHVYLYEYNGALDDLDIDRGEVAEVRFISMGDFEKEINDPKLFRKYVPRKKYYEKVIKEIRRVLA